MHSPGSDLAFVSELRDAITRYLQALDTLDAAQGHKPKGDLPKARRDYQEARRRLESVAPRARRLYFRHGVRDPFHMLLRVSTAPPEGPLKLCPPAIGANERTELARGLVDLLTACAEAGVEESRPGADASQRMTWWRRIKDYFF